MLTDRAEGLMRISRLTKYLIAAVALPLLALLTADADASSVSIRASLLPSAFIFVTLLAFGPSWFAWNSTYFHSPAQTAIKLTTVESVFIAITWQSFEFLAPDAYVPSSQTVALLPAIIPLLLLLNRFLPNVAAAVLYRWRSPQRILTVGSGHAMELIGHQLQKASKLGLIRVNNCSTDGAREGIRIFNPDELPDESLPLSEIEDVVLNDDSSVAIDHVVFVEDSTTKNNPPLRAELQRHCDSLGVPLTVYTEHSGIPPWNNAPIPLSVPHVSRNPSAPLQNPVNQFAKRCIDILVSLPVVIFVLPPLCLLVRSIHRRQSPGPLFYRQDRCGRNGTSFRILKFRTMHAPADGETDIEADPGPRIFRLGAMLRDSRLDEIPQFINVLAGTMSIVGPRAHHAQDRIRFSSIVPHYPMRMQAKPGITGLAQYREYRGMFHRNSANDRVDCDLTYIATWNLELDLVLMVKTAGLIAESLTLAAVRSWRGTNQYDTEPAVSVETPSLVPDQRAA